MAPEPLVILGSARKDSDTRKLIDRLLNGQKYKLLDLLDFEINPYQYAGNYPSTDQFLYVIDQMVHHDRVVFATPVYWYAMSGLMKTFFDRLTDIVTVHKPLGRQLAGKETFLLAVGSDDALPLGFEVPVKKTSEYFGMHFRAAYYADTKAINGLLPNSDAYLSLLHV